MSLTREEVEIVAKRLATYPAGISAYRWGYGPLMELSTYGVTIARRNVLQEYG